MSGNDDKDTNNIKIDPKQFPRREILPDTRVPSLDWPAAVAAQLQADSGQYNSRSRPLQ